VEKRQRIAMLNEGTSNISSSMTIEKQVINELNHEGISIYTSSKAP